MKQSRLHPPVLVSFTAIVLVVVSFSSASVTFWDDSDSAANGYYNSLQHWQDNSTTPILNPDEFHMHKILRITDSVQLHSNPDEIHGQNLFQNILISKTFYAMPDELLTPGMNIQAPTPNRPSEPDNDIVFDNDAGYTKSMRTPAPTSLLLVAIGLLSLRFARRLRY
ncbi:MAG: hypothetical protein ACYS3S_17475 [Planctomycetota bacterium]